MHLFWRAVGYRPKWWLRFYIPVEHRRHWRKHPETHRTHCVCKGTGELLWARDAACAGTPRR